MPCREKADFEENGIFFLISPFLPPDSFQSLSLIPQTHTLVLSKYSANSFNADYQYVHIEPEFFFDGRVVGAGYHCIWIVLVAASTFQLILVIQSLRGTKSLTLCSYDTKRFTHFMHCNKVLWKHNFYSLTSIIKLESYFYMQHLTEEKIRGSRAGFLNLGAIDIWGQTTLCCGDLSCTL